MTEANQAIISIRPGFAEAIFAGLKTVELRRRIPPLDVGTRLWIYATRPVGAVMGSAIVGRIVRSSPDDLWTQFGNRACISREDYDTYFHGASEAIGLILIQIARGKPIEIEKLRRMRDGFHPPQVIARITDTEAKSLRLLSKAG
jgi:predicted transcriptional regulator